MEIKIESLNKEELENWLSIALYGNFWASVNKESKGEFFGEVIYG